MLLAWLPSHGQNYPVQIQALAKPPYTTYLADLSSPTSEQLYVTLMLKDLQLANRQVRLKTTIEGPGTRIVGMDNVAAPPINLLPGSMIQLTGSDLAVYFRPENLQIQPAQYARSLPEGLYRFCFTAFDYQTNQQLSATICSNYAWLQRSDPPLVVLPSSTQPVPALPAQQVLFQWIPRHSQVSAVDYEITLTEIIVPQGFGGNPQNLFFAQPPFFTTRTSGTTFLYGPGSPPLTPGRLYGYRVQAVPKPGQEGRVAFVNDGYSQVGFFAYGASVTQNALTTLQNLQKPYTKPTPPESIAKTMKGRVVWSFKKTELEPDTAQTTWVVKTPAQAYGEVTRRVTSPGEKSSVANPLENAQVSVLANGRLIGTAKTDKDGNYVLNGFNPDVLSGVSTLTVRTTSTADFAPLTRTVSIQRGQGDYDLGQSTLIAQTFRFASQLVSADLPKEDLSLRVLRRKDIVARLPYLVREGSDTREDVTYNGQSYVSIATLTSTRAARRIFYNTTGGDQLVVQVQAKGKSPMYFPLSSFNEAAGPDGNKPLLYLKRNYTYKSTVTLAGKVGTRSPGFTPREGVRVTVTIAQADRLDGTKSDFTKTVTTDRAGQYTLAELPLLRKNGQLALQAVDNTLSPTPQNETISFTGNEVLAKDITLRSTVSLVAGVLNDQYGKPVSGGLVKVQATGQLIRTNEYGFFIVKAYGTSPVSIQFAAPGFDQQSATYQAGRFSWNERNPDENSRTWERTLGGYKSVSQLLSAAGASTLSPSLLGYGDETVTSVYDRLVLPNEQLGSMIDAGVVTIRNQQGLVQFVTTLNGSPTTARIEIGDGKSGETGANGWDYSGAGDVIRYKVVPVSNLTPYLPVSGEVTVTAGEKKTITIALEKAVVLRGTVTQKSDKKPVGDAQIEVEELPYSTTSSADGSYRLYLPYKREMRVKAKTKNHNTTAFSATLLDTRTYDFVLDERDTTLPELKTILGYTIDAEKLERISGKTVKVSGKLTLPTGMAFESASAKTLTFTDVLVDVDEEGDSRPQRDIVFKETELELKAFKFAPVMLESRAGLTLRRFVAEQAVGLLGGSRLRLNTDRLQDAGGFTLNLLPRTTLTFVDPNDERGKLSELLDRELKDFATAFCNLKSFPAVLSSAKYKLGFDLKTTQLTGLSKEEKERLEKDGEKFFPFRVTFLTFLFEKEKCALTEKGIEFVGKVRLPQAAKFKWLNDDVEIEKLTIGTKLELKELALKITDKSPLEARMGSWRARLNRLIIYDNFKGVGFGGRIATTDNKDNDLIIDKLYYVNQGSSLKIGGKITLPKDGYKVSSVKFTTPKGFEVAYLSAKKAFEIDGTLKIDYTGTAKSSVFTLFPLEVQRFTYRSSQEMLVAIKANASLTLGPVKVNIRRFLFNRGIKMTVDEMNTLMQRDSTENANLASSSRFSAPESKARDAVSEESLQKFDELGAKDEDREVPFAESQVSWGIGVAGGVELDVRSMQVKSDASVLVVDNAGSVQVRVNEFFFQIDNSSFKAEIRAKTVNTDVRQGFEGSGNFETLSRKFACSFKYYKVGPAASDLELGLALIASTQIPMGSVTWTQLGGAIDFNIKEKKYYVALMGALTPTGVDKKLVEFDRVKVSILFDLIECGAKPVIKGSAGAKINQTDWGIANVTLDFCRTRLIVDLNSDVEILKGFAKLRVNALLYAKTNMAFFGCNARLNIPKIGDANVLIAIGISARRDQMPEAETIWRQVSSYALDENGQYFNGVNVRGDAKIDQQEGGYSINLGIGDASFRYRYWADASLEFYGRFSRAEFGVYGRVRAGGSASVNLLGAGFNGGADASLEIRGGYGESQGWYFNGEAMLRFYLDNDSGRGCNSAGMRWCSKEVCIGYPCGWGDWCHKCWGVPYPCGFSFKLCRDVRTTFNWRSR